MSGGQITGSMSYFVYAIIEKGENLKLEDTWVQLNQVFKLPVDVVLGQFQVSDPVFKRELRLERNDSAILETRVGVLPTDLTYDCGFVVTWHAPASIDVIGQLVNGNGIDEATDDNFDDNSLKNWSLRLVRPFGPVRVGLLGYWGSEETENGSLTVNYLIARNVRLITEAFYDIDLEQSRLSLGLMAAF
jgi:hypothetical protein